MSCLFVVFINNIDQPAVSSNEQGEVAYQSKPSTKPSFFTALQARILQFLPTKSVTVKTEGIQVIPLLTLLRQLEPLSDLSLGQRPLNILLIRKHQQCRPLQLSFGQQCLNLLLHHI